MWLQSKCVVFLLFILCDQLILANQPCSITEDELAEMKETVSRINDQKETENVSGCEKLLSTTIDSVNNLKSYLTLKMKENNEVYGQTEQILLLKEQSLTRELEEIPLTFQEKYKSDLEFMTDEMTTLYEMIDKLHLEQENYEADLIYYTDYLNNGTKFVSRFDFDSYFETAKQCTFRHNRVKTLITEFNELFALLLGDSSNLSSKECFTELRPKVGSIENIMGHRIGENKIKSLKSTYDERSRCLRKLIDDYTLHHEQQAMLNVTTVGETFQALKLEHDVLKAELVTKKRLTIFKGFQTVKKMILEGTKFRKAREVFLKIRKDIPDSYKKLLNQTYNCDANKLYATLRFAVMFNRFPGYEIVKNKMKDCGQITSPFILQIALTTRDATLSETIDDVYDGWINQIRNGKYDQIQDFMLMLNDDVISFQKLFARALNSNSSDIKSLLTFIDSLSAYNQKIVAILYEEMMLQKLAYTPVHFEIVQWLKDKLNWIEQYPSNSAVTGDLKEHLDILIEKIPSSMRVFFFEPSVILATENIAYLMRSDTHAGIKFKVIPHPDGSKKFYRFEDLRYDKAFHVTKFKDVNSNEERNRVRLGTGNTEDYYWSICPSNQPEFFHLENKRFPDHFLSSDEDNVCLEKGLWGSCRKKEWMNKVYSVKSSSTKWTFTTRLIRKGLLPDRNEG